MSTRQVQTDTEKKLTKHLASATKEPEGSKASTTKTGKSQEDVGAREQSVAPERYTGRRISSISLNMSDGIIDFRSLDGGYTSQCDHGEWDCGHRRCRNKKRKDVGHQKS